MTIRATFTDLPNGVNYNLNPALIDPVGAKYFSFYPSPNVAGTNQFVGAAKNTQTSDAFDARLDYKLNDKNSVFVRTSFNKVLTNTTGTFPQVTVGSATFYPNINIATSPDKAVNSQVNYLHIFSPSLLMEAKAGYTFIGNSSAGSTRRPRERPAGTAERQLPARPQRRQRDHRFRLHQRRRIRPAD